MTFTERQLRAFLTIADTGSLGRAAQLVNLAQPSLSRVIQGLEERLSAPLFDRTSRGMELTAAGRILQQHARHLLGEMQAARDDLAALRGLHKGTVRIGGVSTALRLVLPDVLSAMLASAPGLVTSVVEAGDEGLVEELLGRSIDLAISTTRHDRPDLALVGQCHFGDEYAVYCRTASAIADRPDCNALARARWVLPPINTVPRKQFVEIMRRNGHDPDVVAVEALSPDTMAAISARTDLLCWLPEPMVTMHLSLGQLRRLAVPDFSGRREFFLYRRANGLLPTAAARFVDLFPLADKALRG